MFKDLLNPVLPSEANGATEEDDLFEAIESGHQTFPLVPGDTQSCHRNA
jgi:hypothetical protein